MIFIAVNAQQFCIAHLPISLLRKRNVNLHFVVYIFLFCSLYFLPMFACYADALYGLNGMTTDCAELRALLTAVGQRIDANKGKLDSQEIGNAL